MYVLFFLRLNSTPHGGFSVLWLIVKIWLLSGAEGCKFRSIPSVPKTEFSQSGTLNIGIIMSLHAYDPAYKCSKTLRPLWILQRMESMVFAINEINDKKLVHPNATLGFTVFDDCTNDITALSKAMDLIENLNTCSQNAKFVSVIGADSSTRTINVANVLSIFKVPQLSFSATTPILDDTRKFPYFFRTVPSDVMQAQAIVDILQRFQWSYVSILFHDGSYGEVLYDGLEILMSRIGYCFAVVQRIRQESDEFDYMDVALKLSREPRAHAVILALTVFEVKDMFATFAQHWKNNFTWIVAEYVGGMAHKLTEVKDVVSGMLALRLQSAPVERFNEYFKYLTIRNGSKNPWFKKFFENAFECETEVSNSCNWDVAIQNSSNYEPESTVSLAMDAVYAFAHALKAVLDNCLNTTLLRECVDGNRLRDAMTKVNFRGEHVHISFNKDGSALSSYEINNVYFKDGKAVVNNVGVWNSSTKNFTYFYTDNIKWNWELNPLVSMNENQRKPPLSTCREICPLGFQQTITHKCCWNCSRCAENERTVISQNIQVCSICPGSDNFTWPDNSTRTKCLPIPATFNDLSQKVAVTIFALNFLVLVSALNISTLYIINRNNRLIKASSREVSQMMLGGHMIVCLMAITYFFEPLEATCALFYFWFLLSFSITYGPLLVKTNRIYRIFFRKKRTTQKPRFTSPKAQIVMVTVIIGIQILLSAVGLVLQPPKVVLMMPSIHTKYVEVVCASDMKSMALSLTYIFCLAVGCAVHAYKVRNLPSNFNEAKFIVISLYCIALLWIGVIPGYFTADTEIVKRRWLVVFMLLNMFVAQLFLFYPKLFAIYCLDMSILFTSSQRLSTAKTRTHTKISNE